MQILLDVSFQDANATGEPANVIDSATTKHEANVRSGACRPVRIAVSEDAFASSIDHLAETGLSGVVSGHRMES